MTNRLARPQPTTANAICSTTNNRRLSRRPDDYVRYVAALWWTKPLRHCRVSSAGSSTDDTVPIWAASTGWAYTESRARMVPNRRGTGSTERSWNCRSGTCRARMYRQHLARTPTWTVPVSMAPKAGCGARRTANRVWTTSVNIDRWAVANLNDQPMRPYWHALWTSARWSSIAARRATYWSDRTFVPAYRTVSSPSSLRNVNVSHWLIVAFLCSSIWFAEEIGQSFGKFFRGCWAGDFALLRRKRRLLRQKVWC